MFDELSAKILGPLRSLGSSGKITEKNIEETLKEIRIALLEADVHFKVTKEFLQVVKEEALGQDLVKSISPGQQFTKVVHDALVRFLGGESKPLDLSFAPPVPILMVGLQGSGKTTSSAKIASFLKRKKKKNVLLVPADNRRPAAKEQLQKIAEMVGISCFDSDLSKSPKEIALAAMEEAKKSVMDVLLIDTAGRTSVEEELMEELKEVHEAIEPKQVLFVADSMTGQEAVNVAQRFHEFVPLTGVVLTKLDGDARGGAALSIKYLTGLPIVFVGVGEAPSAIEEFHADRIAGRILDMGDVLSLVEKAQEVIDEKEAEDSIQRVKKGHFTLNDFLKQMQMMKKMGSLEGIMKMLPGGGKMMKQVKEMNVEKELQQMEVIIQSMTKEERRNHKVLNGSRRSRIAKGSGTTVADVNYLVKKYEEAKRTMKKMMKSGFMRRFTR